MVNFVSLNTRARACDKKVKGRWDEEWPQVVAYFEANKSWPSKAHPTLGRFMKRVNAAWRGDARRGSIPLDQYTALREMGYTGDTVADRAGGNAGKGSKMDVQLELARKGELPSHEKLKLQTRWANGRLSKKAYKLFKECGVNLGPE